MTTVTGATGSRQAEFMRNAGNGAELDKHAFLKLLITQLRHQDPLNPSNNGEFLAQMAQFTALEQTQSINAGIEMMNTNQTAYQNALLGKMDNLKQNTADLLYLSQFAQFTGIDAELLLLGKEVTMKTAAGEEIVGKVTSIQLDQAGNRLIVDGQVFTGAQLVKVHSGE